MLKIELNKNEFNYLCKASFLKDRYRKILFASEHRTDHYSLSISEEQADEIRDLCGTQLQIAGFNDNYELTPEGEILESLIDKFLIQ